MTNVLPLQFLFIFSLIIFELSACTPMQVETDYDHAIDFTRYQQYQWIPNEQPDLVEKNIDKDLLDETITKTVTTELTNKGYSRVSEHPDFLVSYYLVVNTKTDVYYVNEYYAGIGFNPQPSRTTAQDYRKIRDVTYSQGILIIDVLDAKTNERVWRGYAQSRLEYFAQPDKTVQRATTAIQKILSRFPP
ncbi:MAG: DUF4136 domain-containing protein [Gammaproteobacteria bacterium]|jgi:hypothetical protein